MRKAIEFILALSVVWLVRFVFNESNTIPAITLCETCPPGFELTEDNICKLRTLYQLYETGNNDEPGVGGLKTPAPTCSRWVHTATNRSGSISLF